MGLLGICLVHAACISTHRVVAAHLVFSSRRPPKLRIEIWDKDQQTPDDMICSTELTLSDCGTGSISAPMQVVDEDEAGEGTGNEPVPVINFSYEFQAEAELVQETKKSVLGKSMLAAEVNSGKKSASKAAAPSPSPAKGKKR